MKKTQNTNTNTSTQVNNIVNTLNAQTVASAQAQAVADTSTQAVASKQASKKASTSKKASKQASAQAVAQAVASSSKQASEKKQVVKIETLYSDMKKVIDLSKFDNAQNLACNELNFNEFVINQVIDNNLVALAKIYAHKNRYDLLLNKSRLTVLFANALKANELLNVSFNAKKLETKKQYVIELNLQQLEQYIVILFDLTKKQNDNKQ